MALTELQCWQVRKSWQHNKTCTLAYRTSIVLDTCLPACLPDCLPSCAPTKVLAVGLVGTHLAVLPAVLDGAITFANQLVTERGAFRVAQEAQ